VRVKDDPLLLTFEVAEDRLLQSGLHGRRLDAHANGGHALLALCLPENDNLIHRAPGTRRLPGRPPRSSIGIRGEDLGQEAATRALGGPPLVLKCAIYHPELFTRTAPGPGGIAF